MVGRSAESCSLPGGARSSICANGSLVRVRRLSGAKTSVNSSRWRTIDQNKHSGRSGDHRHAASSLTPNRHSSLSFMGLIRPPRQPKVSRRAANDGNRQTCGDNVTSFKGGDARDGKVSPRFRKNLGNGPRAGVARAFQPSYSWAAAPTGALEEFPKRNLQPGEKLPPSSVCDSSSTMS